MYEVMQPWRKLLMTGNAGHAGASSPGPMGALLCWFQFDEYFSRRAQMRRIRRGL